MDGIINLYDLETEEKIVLDDNKIALTDKVSELLGVNVGDKIILRDSNDKEVPFYVSADGNDDSDGGNQIKSVAVTSNSMVVLRYSDDDTVIVYKGDPTTNGTIELKQKGIIYEDLPSVTQSIIIENELIFVKYNGSSNSSDLYVVDLGDIEGTRRSHETSIAGLNAEAFFKISTNDNVYMLTKDKGVFKINDTTVTPVPDLRRI